METASIIYIMTVNNTLHNVAGSITAGIFSTAIGHPLDTIKIHQQTKSHLFTNPSSSFHVARVLSRGNVFRLFKGIGPPMANQIIMNTVMFTVFQKTKDVMMTKGQQRGGDGDGAAPLLDETSVALFSGLLSGFATACLSTPFDWFKIQAQLTLLDNQNGSVGGVAKASRSRTDVLTICKQLWHDSNGQGTKVMQTIYRGHTPNLAREGVFTMVYLGLYDLISSEVKKRRNQVQEHDQQQQLKLPMHEVIMISSFTGACAWICNYPFDTIKSVMQSSSRECRGSVSNSNQSISAAVRSIYRLGGVRGFFSGAFPSTVRAILVTSSRMLAYEKTLQMLGN